MRLTAYQKKAIRKYNLSNRLEEFHQNGLQSLTPFGKLQLLISKYGPKATAADILAARKEV